MSNYLYSWLKTNYFLKTRSNFLQNNWFVPGTMACSSWFINGEKFVVLTDLVNKQGKVKPNMTILRGKSLLIKCKIFTPARNPITKYLTRYQEVEKSQNRVPNHETLFLVCSWFRSPSSCPSVLQNIQLAKRLLIGRE